jgi:hypothetical protein
MLAALLILVNTPDRIKVWQTSSFKAGWGFGSLWFLTSSRVLLWGWGVHLWVDVLEG